MEGLNGFLLALAALAAPVAVIIGLFAKRTANKAEAQISEVHILVNSKMTDALTRIEVLEAQLKEARGGSSV